jgi:hypothetical protein
MDQFESALASYVRGLVAFDQGHRVTDSLEASRQAFRTALRNVLGAKVKERVEP